VLCVENLSRYSDLKAWPEKFITANKKLAKLFTEHPAMFNLLHSMTMLRVPSPQRTQHAQDSYSAVVETSSMNSVCQILQQSISLL